MIFSIGLIEVRNGFRTSSSTARKRGANLSLCGQQHQRRSTSRSGKSFFEFCSGKFREKKHRIFQVFLEFRRSNFSFDLHRYLIEKSNSSYVIYQTLTALRESIVKDWFTVDGQVKEQVVQYLLSYVYSNFSVLSVHVREQALQILVVINKRRKAQRAQLAQQCFTVSSALINLLQSSNEQEFRFGLTLLNAFLTEYSFSNGSPRRETSSSDSTSFFLSAFSERSRFDRRAKTFSQTRFRKSRTQIGLGNSAQQNSTNDFFHCERSSTFLFDFNVGRENSTVEFFIEFVQRSTLDGSSGHGRLERLAAAVDLESSRFRSSIAPVLFSRLRRAQSFGKTKNQRETNPTIVELNFQGETKIFLQFRCEILK